MSAKAEDKEAILTGLVQVRRQILNAAALSPTQQDDVFLGIWSVKDLLAHLVGWDYTNLEAAKSVLAGELPAFYAHYDRDWQTYNARLVAEYKKDDFGEMLASVEDSHHQLVAFLETVPAEDYDRDTGVRFNRYKVTIARLLRVEIRDEQKHHAQIQAFRDRAEP